MSASEVVRDWKDNKGFPYYPEDRKWRNDEFAKLTSFNRDTRYDPFRGTSIEGKD